eukprot:4823787-Alexandrium_andersonii.AAC.1
MCLGCLLGCAWGPRCVWDAAGTQSRSPGFAGAKLREAAPNAARMPRRVGKQGTMAQGRDAVRSAIARSLRRLCQNATRAQSKTEPGRSHGGNPRRKSVTSRGIDTTSQDADTTQGTQSHALATTKLLGCLGRAEDLRLGCLEVAPNVFDYLRMCLGCPVRLRGVPGLCHESQGHACRVGLSFWSVLCAKLIGSNTQAQTIPFENADALESRVILKVSVRPAPNAQQQAYITALQTVCRSFEQLQKFSSSSLLALWGLPPSRTPQQAPPARTGCAYRGAGVRGGVGAPLEEGRAGNRSKTFAMPVFVCCHVGPSPAKPLERVTGPSVRYKTPTPVSETRGGHFCTLSLIWGQKGSRLKTELGVESLRGIMCRPWIRVSWLSCVRRWPISSEGSKYRARCDAYLFVFLETIDPPRL